MKEMMEVKEMELRQGLSIQEKLRILADAAKYDVACTSSGVDRKGMKGSLGNSKACGICHSFSADGRCISLLKVLLTNHCVYDCKYCANRVSNDTEPVSYTHLGSSWMPSGCNLSGNREDADKRSYPCSYQR